MPSRHVHTVRLTASSDTLMRRGAILLEDALHTASLPDADGGRLLIVRSLDIGTINTRQSSASLAIAVERRFQELNAIAVHGTDAVAASQAVVYFRDVTEAYTCLAERLVQGQPTDAWFWSRAVPKWRSGLSTPEALRWLLYGITQTPAGVGAMVRLVTRLQQTQGVDRLLSVLCESDGAMLLQVCGWSHPPTISPAGALTLPMGWLPTLQTWIGNWGAEDARSRWLATVALVSQQPARLMDIGIVGRSQQLIQQILTAERVLRSSTEPFATPSKTQPVSSQSASSEQPESPKQLTSKQPDPERSISEPLPVPVDEQPSSQKPARVQSSETSAIETNSSAPKVPTASEQTVQRSIERFQPPDSPPNSIAPDPQQIDAIEPDSASPELMDTPQSTDYAGLFFLLPLMAHLDMAEFLSCHSHLIDLDLPQQLLRLVAQRLNIPADDPVLFALIKTHAIAASETAQEHDFNDQFVAPDCWQSICQAGTWRVRRVANTDRPRTTSRVLVDGSGRLMLALWDRGDRPHSSSTWREQIHRLIQERPLRRDQQPVTDPNVIILLNAWITAIRRWCRRYARMGLHDLVCRPGSITATPTHLDLYFDLRQTDFRIRRVGLDLDLGWLPWFGRIILFHYL